MERERHYSAFTPAGFLNIRARVWENAAADTTVLCVHGIARNSSDFVALGRRLASRYNVVAPDLVGHGKSDWPATREDYLSPLQAYALGSVLAQMPRDQKIVWLGVSMGGASGIRLASRKGTPVAGLILNDIGAYVRPEQIAAARAMFARLPRFESLDSARAFIRRVPSFNAADASEAELDSLVRDNVRLCEDGYWALAFDPRIEIYYEEGRSKNDDGWQFWEALQCPVLIFRGERSPMLSAGDVEEMCTRRPDTKAITVPDAGHPPDLTGERELNEISKWIKGLGPPPANACSSAGEPLGAPTGAIADKGDWRQ